MTARLAPGPCRVRAESPGCEAYALPIGIVAAEPDSPIQRVIYHEMGNAGGADQNVLPDLPEKLDFVRRWAEGMARLHVNRETDRIMALGQWRRDAAPADVSPAAFAPAEYFALPSGPNWAVEAYLDQAVRQQIRVDSQILGHCSGVRFRDFWLDQLKPQLQQAAEARRRYPSFYGFNYNDEMFFGEWVTDWTPSDVQWLKETATRFAAAKNPMSESRMTALRRMYDGFNSAVSQVCPEAHRTCTPMWQFPAVAGSYQPVVYKDMTETYSHYVSEGYHIPWYAPHSAENLRRPRADGSCLPLMGVVDPGVHAAWGYEKNAVQVLGRGVQGIGFSYGSPWEGATNDSVRTVHLLAKMYGGVFAECPPANEAALLYSYAQDVTENRNGPGTPHWERVWEMFGAGLMAGVPSSIVCEEDVAAGYLLQDGRPRTTMLFLLGQTEPLPAAVQQAIARYAAAGGRLFVDADSAAYPGATRLPLETHRTGPLHGQTYAADSAFPVMMPVLERLAADLHKAVGSFRRQPVDTDDPWVAKSRLDGSAVQYLALATEVSPFPWDEGAAWSLMSACYNGQWLPKTVTLTTSMTGGVIYDVFEQKVVHRQQPGSQATLQVDLTTFPGKLLAIAPEELAPPRIVPPPSGAAGKYAVTIVGQSGQRLAARVPLRVRLLADSETIQTLFRGTDATGVWEGVLTLPVNRPKGTLEVTELLGGKATRVEITGAAPPGKALLPRDDVEIQRGPQIESLLSEAVKSGLTLVAADPRILDAETLARLRDALRPRAIELRIAGEVPKEPSPGTYLAVGCTSDEKDLLDPMLRVATEENLLGYPLTQATVPGPGRGLICPVFSVRKWREQMIAIVGGDVPGLNKAVRQFAATLAIPGALAAAKADDRQPCAASTFQNQPCDAPPVPRLSEMAGVRLAGVYPAADGKHLLVTAEGYWKNVALVRDEGPHAVVTTARRVGQSREAPLSPYASADATLIGASGRVTADCGDAFCLVDGGGLRALFAGFGDVPPHRHAFAANSAADTVVCGGVYGAVCWKKDAAAKTGWREAWAIDHWKEFDQLDWPVSDTAERCPRFDVYIPRVPTMPWCCSMSSHRMAGLRRRTFAGAIWRRSVWPMAGSAGGSTCRRRTRRSGRRW